MKDDDILARFGLRLIIVIALFLIGGGYMVFSDTYNRYLASDETIRLPVKESFGEDLYIHNNRSSVDPTYDELLAFIREDATDWKIRKNFSFGMLDYAVMVHDNAEKKGIRTGIKVWDARGEIGDYVCNVFETQDYGRVMVDCSGQPNQAGHDYIVFTAWTDDKHFGQYYEVPLEYVTDMDLSGGSSLNHFVMDENMLLQAPAGTRYVGELIPSETYW